MPIKKLTAGVVMLASTLFSITVHAAPAPVSAQPAAAVGQSVPTVQETTATTDAENAPPAANDFTSAAKDHPASRAQELTVPEQSGPDPQSTDIDKLNLHYLKGVAIDTGKIIASPIHWDKKDWLRVGVVVGVTGTLLLVDDKIKDFAQDHQNHVTSKFAALGNDLGNGLYTLPLVGAFYAYGALGDDHKARKTSLLALESFAISGLLTEGVKAIGGRHRPNTGDRATTFDGPDYMKNVSFSSGHTASAFAIATVFADQYKDNAWVPAIAYSLATLTGLSRIYINEHWASDVFFGGALGYFTSKALLKWHEHDKDQLLGKRLTIMPQLGQQMTGLKVNYQF
ncbi:phosphatase PAP2 family protein [Geomonas sp.]|uniref:phosphatase PAP2 family protein n=1 Tax=Geomonas sp. TaxID=2651584 RepID=UPI002B4A22D2|nr:phosphatase PAP2 family protein [Geomonas sp.]HJV36319.1 phosphatase PAP2 family protein [Geomonas sp.]